MASASGRLRGRCGVMKNYEELDGREWYVLSPHIHPLFITPKIHTLLVF